MDTVFDPGAGIFRYGNGKPVDRPIAPLTIVQAMPLPIAA